MTEHGAAWAAIEDMRVGREAVLRERITPQLIGETARVTGDWNPLHVNAQAALELGQSRPVAHGVILIGLVSRLIGTQLPGPGAVWFANDVEFTAPVYPGDEVELRGRITHVSIATNVVVLELTAQRANGDQVLKGTAKVRVPNRMIKEASLVSDSERVAVVTGASRGLGRSIAQSFGRRGMRVAVNYRSDEAGAKETADLVREAGGTAITVKGDVATPAGAAALVDASVDSFGRIDVLVHNATPPIESKPYTDTTGDDFRRYFDTYVVGLHELALRVVPGMKERRFGRLLAISSSYTVETPTKFAAYITGKQALVGLCRVLAVELGPFGITVNAVSPSMLIGPQTDSLGVSARDVLARKTPLRRLGQTADVAGVVDFLAGDGAGFISGANVPVSGGILF